MTAKLRRTLQKCPPPALTGSASVLSRGLGGWLPVFLIVPPLRSKVPEPAGHGSVGAIRVGAPVHREHDARDKDRVEVAVSLASIDVHQAES